ARLHIYPDAGHIGLGQANANNRSRRRHEAMLAKLYTACGHTVIRGDTMQKTTRAIGVVAGLLLCGLATVNAGAADWRDLEVTATAYNSVAAQTDADPSVAAWG